MDRNSILKLLEVALDNAATSESASFSVSVSKLDDGTFSYYVDDSYDTKDGNTQRSQRRSRNFTSQVAL
jgi:hypothetical protein